MKHLMPTLRSRSVSSIVLIVAITALCFSVGEGLRLTPFPVSQNQVDPAKASSTGEASQFSAYTYGPLAAPAQPQKRSKRVAIEVSCPVSTYTHELLTSLHVSPEHESQAIGSVLLVAFPSDRAPPLTA